MYNCNFVSIIRFLDHVRLFSLEVLKSRRRFKSHSHIYGVYEKLFNLQDKSLHVHVGLKMEVLGRNVVSS